MTRYFGVFTNRHYLRPRIIPPSAAAMPGQQLPVGLADSANHKPEPRYLSDSGPERALLQLTRCRADALAPPRRSQ
jgi:hypothetical protein